MHPNTSDQQADLLGSWKLLSWFQQDVVTNEKMHLMGQHPTGYAVFAPTGRVSFILTGEGRGSPQSHEDQAAVSGQ